MRSLLLFVFLLISIVSFAQLKSKLAEEHFKRMEYGLCVSMFDELTEKGIRKGFSDDNFWEHIRKSALCHYHLFEFDRACDRYALLKKNGKLTKIDLEFYYKALRSIGEYDKSSVLLTEYPDMLAQSEYLNRMSKATESKYDFYRDSARIKIRVSGINSGKGDFAPSYFEEDLYYVSKEKNARNFNSLYAWDLDYFTNFHKAEGINDSTFTIGTLQKDQLLSKSHDGPVSFNSSGTRMLITRNLPVSKGSKATKLAIYYSEQTNGTWSEPVLMSINLEGYNSGHAVFFGNNDHLIYFASDRPGGVGKS
ncbi:MAG: hypothetical protein RIT43_1021, partial [Bacteroidota bacterium]